MSFNAPMRHATDTSHGGGDAGPEEARDPARHRTSVKVHMNDDEGPAGPGRGEMVGLALQIDAMIARSDEMGLDLVAYLLSVARAEMGERLGERRSAAPHRPDMGHSHERDVGEA